MIEPRRSRFAQVAPFATLTFLQIVLDETCTVLVLPQIQYDLGISEALAYWISSAYYISNSATSIPLSRIGDGFGYVNAFRVLCAVFCAVYVLIIFADQFWEILLIRIATGVLNSGMTSIFNIIKVNLLFPETATIELQKGVILSNFLSIIIPIVGAVLAYYLNWRVIYILCAVLGVINFAVSFCYRNFNKRMLVEMDGAEPEVAYRFDVWGSLVFVAFMACFCLSFTMLSYQNYTIFGILISITVVLCIAFVAVERKVTNPLVPRFVLHLPVSALLTLYIFLYFGVTCCNWVMPQILSYYGLDGYVSGIVTSVYAAACLATSVICTFLTRRIVTRILIYVSYALLNVVIVASGLAVTNEILYCAAYIISFLFFAVQMQNLYVLLLRSVAYSKASVISGLQACMRTFGQSVSLSFFTMIYSVASYSVSYQNAYSVVMYSLLPFTLAGCAISFFFVYNPPEEREKAGFDAKFCRSIDLE